MIKACIIGVSGYGRVHYQLLLDQVSLGNIKIVAATIINQLEEKEKCEILRKHECVIYEDYHLMLKELVGEVDLCMIPTGTPLHKPMTIAALEARMNVLVEKPAAGCYDDVLDMEKKAKEVDKKVFVGYQHMYSNMAMTANINYSKVLLER